MKKDRRGGYALISVLVTAFVLFSLLSLALSANYSLHRLNRRFAEKLQSRADRLGP